MVGARVAFLRGSEGELSFIQETEHEFVDATVGDVTESVSGRHFTARLAAASELSVDLTMKRHANAPTYDFPWPV